MLSKFLAIINTLFFLKCVTIVFKKNVVPPPKFGKSIIKIKLSKTSKTSLVIYTFYGRLYHSCIIW